MRLLIPLLLVLAAPAFAQGSYDQRVVGDLLEREAPLPSEPVRYAVYRVEHASGNSVLARHALYRRLGDGDVQLGQQRLGLAQLLGGPPAGRLTTGDSLVLPARLADFDLSPLAYAPFPLDWPGAAGIAKVIVIDKTTQTWAAYGSGRLMRWGPASTGAAATPTPSGRFTMNWRTLERASSEAPAGQRWLMRYVMNIHHLRGIHLHQYDVVPTGPPQGHGCIRMVTTDAEWLYGWSDGWQTTAGPGSLGGRPTAPGTLVIVQGTEPTGAPIRFTQGANGPERVAVALPPNPLAVPRGDR